MMDINVTVPTAIKYQLKPESWGGGCIRCKDCEYWRPIVANRGECERTVDMGMIDIVTNPYREQHFLVLTRHDFGCILGEPNPIDETIEQCHGDEPI